MKKSKQQTKETVGGIQHFVLFLVCIWFLIIQINHTHSDTFSVLALVPLSVLRTLVLSSEPADIHTGLRKTKVPMVYITIQGQYLICNIYKI